MPNFKFPSLLKSITFLAFFALLDVGLVHAATNDYTGQSSAAVGGNSGHSEMSLRTRFQAGNFSNRAMGLSGVSYSIGLGLGEPGAFDLYADIPFLWGDNRGAPVQELGNPKIGLDFSLMELGPFQIWAQTSGAITQPSGKLASRFDTYRAGGEFRFRRHRIFSSMGAGRRFRVNENDKDVDVGDMSDFDFSLGYGWTNNWSLLGTLGWLHSDGVKARGLVYARPSEWAGVSPGVRYRGSGGLEITTGFTIPILQSRDEPEMEVAFWDMSLPPISQVSLHTQVGVAF